MANTVDHGQKSEGAGSHTRNGRDLLIILRAAFRQFAEIYKCKSSGQRDQKRKTDQNIRATVTINMKKKASPYSPAIESQSISASMRSPRTKEVEYYHIAVIG